ncbi:hypothetical protein SCHPADRAFT_903315 [Schizopora paradoxa]|uniref:RING-type domain-containing protein n=1 Tax=Schizopora paradoxa TaxID=27342 RepID=A0A0H2SBU1_9AGAM|nr:hypothetical protein SCHPADRAFT_903315 [Schizopora paradoxa]
MAAIASWYNNQYSAWNRTRRLAVPPYLARTDTRTSRAATAISNAQNGENNLSTDTGNMSDIATVLGLSNGTEKEGGKDGKNQKKDTLFGPSIGVPAGGPDWCASKDKPAKEDDELTTDIVKEWIAKSKESAQPTTTLQALVNLKRPTIRLSPLISHTHDGASDTGEHSSHGQQHGLEFEYDCDAPKCGIRLHVAGVPAHYGEDHHIHAYHDVDERMRREKDPGSGDRLLIFDAVVDGGFGRKLHLDEGAVLELSSLEKAALEAAASAAPSVPTVEASSSTDVPSQTEGHHRRKGFPLFRKRGNAGRRDGHSHPQATQTSAPAAPVTAVSGPALAVVDAEPSTSQAPAEPTAADAPGGSKTASSKTKTNEEGGVKITIRLCALDAFGMPLHTRNEQTTYLHICRLGPAPAPAETDATASSNEEKESSAVVEDTRPWVVKVVKREASIGPHTFHLHEIYGLTSHSAEPAHPLAPTESTPAPDHTYPPAPPDGADPPPIIDSPAHGLDSNDSTAECLLCLSSPREVVLLPCRHLVACRECAVNMVEYGAGGQLVHNESEPTGASGATDAGATDGAAPGEAPGGTSDAPTSTPTPPAAPAPPPTQQRRKRKAKGWFCPVCRQPYSSLLRITTTPPPMAASELEAGKRASVSSSIEGSHPLATETTANVQSQPPVTETRSGFSASLPRPGFLRHFTRNPGNGNVADAMTAPDLERGQPQLVAGNA